MTLPPVTLPDGYSPVAAGKVAFVVTSLEMLAPPPRVDGGPQFQIVRVERPDLDWYRDLFRRIGTDWLWFGRLRLTDAELSAVVHDPRLELYLLTGSNRGEGLLELDFRQPAECEIAYFGVTPDLIGRGAGRRLMRHAIETAWSRPIRRLWVHTCTGDHPEALQFYIRSGFRPYRRQIEVADDPRLLGVLPETAAPHVPLLRS